jgi:hypothetical protein
MQMYAAAILADRGALPTNSVADLHEAGRFVQTMALHIHTSEHKDGRWLSWYVHACALDRNWHSMSESRPRRTVLPPTTKVALK